MFKKIKEWLQRLEWRLLYFRLTPEDRRELYLEMLKRIEAKNRGKHE